MNSRVIAAIAIEQRYWELAGDQLYVDFDLSHQNLPSGSHLRVGEALLEVTKIPHTGCKKFVDRFGSDAMRFISSKEGQVLRLRGMNAKIIEGGRVGVGQQIIRL